MLATSYKDAANRRAREFKNGEYVMIRFRLERYPRGIVSTLMARRASPYRVVRETNPNA